MFWKNQVGPLSLLLVITIIFSLLPDVDAIPGLITGEMGKYHNNGTHSLVVGLVVALIFGLALSWKRRVDFLLWFLIIWTSYITHILLDFFTLGGRGVMLFWPLSLQRYQSSLTLFYGVRWGDGVLSTNHLWTLATEVIFALVLLFVVLLAEFKFFRITNRENAKPS